MTRDNWTVYLSGEIHTDWREKIADGIKKSSLPVTLLAPVTDHASSDDCGNVHAPWCTDHTNYHENLCNRPFHRQWHLSIAAGKVGTDKCGVILTVVEHSTQGVTTILTRNDYSVTGTATVAAFASRLRRARATTDVEIKVATDTAAGTAQTVPTGANTANATVHEATTDGATAKRPGVDCGCSQPRDCMRPDNMPFRQHSDNTQPSLNARHSARRKETKARSAHHREMVRTRGWAHE